MSLAKQRARFDALRAQYLANDKAASDHKIALAVRYGREEWASKSDRAKSAQLYARARRIGDRIFALVQSVSPRDWSRGAPCAFIYGELTWEDAIRPKDEPLSVVVPAPYGHSEGLK